MTVKAMNHNGKLGSALELVNQIAKEKKEAICDNFDHAKKMAAEAIEESGNRIKKAAYKVDRNVHKNPWKVIGAFAAGSLALGYFLGLKKR